MTKMLLRDERESGELRQSYVHRYIEIAYSIMSVMTPIHPAALLGQSINHGGPFTGRYYQGKYFDFLSRQWCYNSCVA